MTVDHQGKENAFIRLEGSILRSRFGATWLCEIGNKAKLKPKRKGVSDSLMKSLHVSVMFSSTRSVQMHSTAPKSVLIRRPCSSPDSDRDVAMLATHFRSPPPPLIFMKAGLFLKTHSVL